MKERDIFLAAVDKGSPDDRRSFLELTCGDDKQLRNRIERLLRSHEDADSLLDHPILGDAPTEANTGPTDKWESEQSDDNRVSLNFLDASDEPGMLGRLGQYDVLEVVGCGGMGIVLKAHDTKLDRLVAVKVLSPQLAAHANARKRFLREARAAAAVSHDHVVTIFAVEENVPSIGSDHAACGGLPNLIMEFIGGESLEQKINREGCLELKEILRIGRQIAAGLAAAHQQGLIHRDIKPSNILLQNCVQRVKITDFGLARAANDAGITRTGEVAGTPQYMSPEQAQGKSVDARSDLFSLGSVLYAMCTGHSPFRAETTLGSLRRVCDDSPQPVQTINADIPEWLVTIIERLLEKDPDNRIQSAQELESLLSAHLAQLQSGLVTPAILELPPTSHRALGAHKLGSTANRRRLSRALLVVAAGFLLCLLVGIGEATGITDFGLHDMVMRIAYPDKTLEVVIINPEVKLIVDDGGESLVFQGPCECSTTVRPGKLKISHVEGDEVPRVEWLTVERNGEPVYRIFVGPPESEPIPDSLRSILPPQAPAPAIAPFDAEAAENCQREWAEYLGRDVEWSNSVGMRFVLVPPGEFTMGSSDAEKDWADPDLRIVGNEHLYRGMRAESQRKVWITKPYFVQAHPVTVGAFRSFVEAKKFVTYAEKTGRGIGCRSWDQQRIEQDPQYDPSIELEEDPKYTWRDPGYPQSDDDPVTMITWDEAIEFCKWLSEKEFRSYRLPSEAEWEHACRAGTTTSYYFGDFSQVQRLGEYGWFRNNSLGSTHPVGLKKPNAWGLFDMHGHVWEYCSDLYDREAAHPSHCQTIEIDPQGPAQGWNHMRRGGSFMSTPATCRSAHRNPCEPNYLKCVTGFRVVCEVAANWEMSRIGRQIVVERTEENVDLGASTMHAIAVNLGSGINSRYADERPALSADELCIVFQSNRPGGEGSRDLWTCTRSSIDEPFAEPRNLGAGINTADTELSPALSSDGLRLLFGRYNLDGRSGWWMCEREHRDVPFGEPATFQIADMPADAPGGAFCFTSDGEALVFHNHYDTGFCELWLATRLDSGNNFGHPLNLGIASFDGISSYSPHLSEDGRTMFFGRGGDLYSSSRSNRNDLFGPPERLPSPINSDALEEYPRSHRNGRVIYFSSSRAGGEGNADLWCVTLMERSELTETEAANPETNSSR